MSAPETVLRRVLIANRGEIAVRILRTCARLGIETVLAASDAELDSVPARLADSTVRIGRRIDQASPAGSYLDVRAVVETALAARADAVHPGYGFLSENPRLARACEAAGLVFIGPTAAQLEAVGDKLAARAHARAAGVPVLPGGEVRDPADGERLAAELGRPVLVKAVGGGGGRGLRVVTDPAALAPALRDASSEALAAFGDPRVYLERFVTGGRHVEVQVLGDGRDAIQLGERDCSVQRRHQKLLEEAPAPGLPAGLRAELHAAALAFAEHLRYRGLGTVEFLLEPDRAAFWFLEMNARIQVEHPVTEAVTGLDLVEEQIAVAEGLPLRLAQHEVGVQGHAIECRLTAEDWTRGFRPCPGTVTAASLPAGPGIRVDTHVQAGTAVPPEYDSLLAKLVVHAADRPEAVRVMRGALDRVGIAGVPTTVEMHAHVVRDAEFVSGAVDTGYLDRLLDRLLDRRPSGSAAPSHPEAARG